MLLLRLAVGRILGLLRAAVLFVWGVSRAAAEPCV